MAESSDEKLAFRFASTIDIESSTHGLFRFRNWTVAVDAAINKICNTELTPRRFVEDLFVQLAVDPLLTEVDVKQWTDVELMDVAVKWWNFVGHRRQPPISFDSLEGFQNAIRQRRTEYRKSVTPSIEKTAALRPHILERGTLEEHKTLLKFTGDSEIQKAIERIQLAAQLPTMATLRKITLSHPERWALESVHEQMRNLQLFMDSQQLEFVKFVAVTRPIAEYTAQVERMQREMAGRLRRYEAVFDSSQFKAILGEFHLTGYGRFIPDITTLESLAASFKAPWIDRLRPEISAISISKMAALSAAAQAPHPFADASVTTVRKALGDWREVTMPRRVLPDTNLREQFYIDHSFDTSLIQLPEPAFSEALHNLGLLQPQISPKEEEIDEEEEILRQRMAQVYKLFFRLERRLRIYIDRVMTDKYGADWERHRCHGNGQIYNKWVQKRQLAVRSGLQPQRLIQYADFTEYADLITKADNWKEIFQQIFDRPESVRESFHRLGPVRLCTMHARPITKIESILASAEITRLLIAIGDLEDENSD